MPIRHALAVADTIRYHLDHGPQRDEYRAVTPDEVFEGKEARAKALSFLNSSIYCVDQTLSALGNVAPGKSKGAEKDTRSSSQQNGSILRTTSSFSGVGAPVQNVQDAMSADGLRPGVQSLEKMARAIQPIVTGFDLILAKPYLNNYSATLNTVPVVGLRNGQIMYLETQQDVDPTGSSIREVWSTFSQLPFDANITDNDKVFMFPFKGDFYLAVGRAVWKKAQLDARSPDLKNAIDHWPSIYHKGWEKLGDTVLPTADLLGVVPYAQLSSDGNEIAFQLVILAADSTISFLKGDTLSSDSQFDQMEYVPAGGGPEEAPKFTCVTYWSGQITGYDNDNQSTWNLSPKFQEGTFTAIDQLKVEPILELTATDVGLVGSRADGYLYRRTVEAPAKSGFGLDATLKWTRWVKQDNVTNLGVASPGVMLNLNFLAHTLKSRYLDVQTSVYPVVENIRAFSLTHSVYLNNVRTDADAWKKATTEKQRAIAIKLGKIFIAHSKKWAIIVSRSISRAKDSVNIMTKQLHDVRTQLEIQLSLLRDKLTGLRHILSEENEALSGLRAAFWGMVAASFVGLALALTGAATGLLLLSAGGGALFLGGLIAEIVLSVKIEDLERSMSETESQIRVVTTAIHELSTIVKSFQALDGLYGTLNQFWGRMSNDASAIKTIDNTTAQSLGEGILRDTSSIEASAEITERMTHACQTYLDVLNRQGIKIPPLKAVPSMPSHSPTAYLESALPSLDEQFHQAIESGRTMLAQRNFEGYNSSISRAVMLNLASIFASDSMVITTGMWFDVPNSNSSGTVWGNLPPTILQHTLALSTDIPEAIMIRGSQIGEALDAVKSYVVGMLEKVVELGEAIHSLSETCPQVPGVNQAGVIGDLQIQAIKNCEKAYDYAAMMNNFFIDFNSRTPQLQHHREMKINSDAIARGGANPCSRVNIWGLSQPWCVNSSGIIHVVISWIGDEKRGILDRLNRSIINLNAFRQSGLSFSPQTWVEMCRAVNGNLSSVYNILSGIWQQLLEDPKLHADSVGIEWDQLASNANDALAILHAPALPQTPVPGLLEHLAPAPLARTPKSSCRALINAISPTKTLGFELRAQAENAREAFEKIEVLLRLPYSKDIIGYWDHYKTERKTLFDVVKTLYTEYVQMVATEYDTVQSLYSLSILQEARANSVVKGELPLDVFVEVTLQSVKVALRAANDTSMQFGKSSEQFDFIMGVIESSINEIETKIEKLNDKIELAEEKLREMIVWVIADVIALSFATAALIVSFGMTGPVSEALILSAKIGASAAETAASVKLALDSLSLADVSRIIASLKAIHRSLKTSVVNLKTVQPLFKVVVTGVNELTTPLSDMKSILEKTMDNLGLLDQLSLTAEDAEEIGVAWAGVRDDAQFWMDVINAQGISPIMFSVCN